MDNSEFNPIINTEQNNDSVTGKRYYQGINTEVTEENNFTPAGQCRKITKENNVSVAFIDNIMRFERKNN